MAEEGAWHWGEGQEPALPEATGAAVCAGKPKSRFHVSRKELEIANSSST